MATLPEPNPKQLAENQGPGIIAACLTVAVLATIAVALRLLSRVFQKVRIGMDDYLIILALVRHSMPGWGFITLNSSQSPLDGERV